MEIIVDPKFQGMKLSRRLYEARKELAKKFNLLKSSLVLDYLIIISILMLDIDSYVEKVISKNLYGPVYTAQLANGFSLRKIFCLII